MRRQTELTWKNHLGLIPWFLIVAAAAFIGTKALWFDSITKDNKALFWPSVITAGGTLGLFIVAVIAAVVAYMQYIDYRRDRRVENATNLLREWADPDFQTLIGFADQCLVNWHYQPPQNRKFARRLYLLINGERTERRHSESRDEWRERRRRNRERRELISSGIEEISFMAARTWNLLGNGIIDEDVLFGQIDYEVVSAYFELEDVLAIRQVEDDRLYSEFTWLARAAQRHYRGRPNREVVPDFVQADFDRLPFEEDEFEKYMEKVKSRETLFRVGTETDKEPAQTP